MTFAVNVLLLLLVVVAVVLMLLFFNVNYLVVLQG